MGEEKKKTRKEPEENIGKYFSHSRKGNNFLSKIPKAEKMTVSQTDRDRKNSLQKIRKTHTSKNTTTQQQKTLNNLI